MPSHTQVYSRNSYEYIVMLRNAWEQLGLIRNMWQTSEQRGHDFKPTWNDLGDLDILKSSKQRNVAAADCAHRAFRSLAVQVTESAPERWTLVYLRAKPIVKGGLGGNRSGVRLMGFNFRDFFLCFF